MKEITLSFSWLIAAILIMGISSCATMQNNDSGAVDIHASKISLSWDGVYTGIIPSASGSGIRVLIVLNLDETFLLRYSYVDGPDNIFTEEGSFEWDKDERTITLIIKDWPPYYWVGENKLTQLDMNGNVITGSLAENYVLKKVVPPYTEADLLSN